MTKERHPARTDRPRWTQVHAADDESLRADVHVSDDLVEILFPSIPLHTSAAARADLVRAVFDSPEVRDGRRLLACVPLGESEIVLQLRARCGAVHTRAAGATCLVEADLDHPDNDHPDNDHPDNGDSRRQ
jgi:hypothetical protein